MMMTMATRMEEDPCSAGFVHGSHAFGAAYGLVDWEALVQVWLHAIWTIFPGSLDCHLDSVFLFVISVDMHMLLEPK